MTKTAKIKQGSVDISNPYILISYSDEYGVDDWIPIAVLSVAQTVEQMRLEMLYDDDDIHDSILKMMHEELRFYLFELDNPCNISYLLYHCSTMANIYSNIHFKFIEKITASNLMHYIRTKSQLDRICFTSMIGNIQDMYTQAMTLSLWDSALDTNFTHRTKDQFNNSLNELYKILFVKLPEHDGFEIGDQDRFNLIEFSSYLAELDIADFSYILNYLMHLQLIGQKDIPKMLNFFYQNKRLCRE